MIYHVTNNKRIIGDEDIVLAGNDERNTIAMIPALTCTTPAIVTIGNRNIEESKKHQVTSFPDIKRVPFKPAEHDFIICACDGIWDCFSNEQAIKFIRQKRERGPK